ncbi:MAG: ABC transporter, permease protein 2 (cluster 4, leucine/isoleucine/valine/benzoate) / ABC transporter, ATP-binding protein 1 (cluster 4, leucine/isoleucine/valine/benzoate), partial [uncultured Blastococcus sp.]
AARVRDHADLHRPRGDLRLLLLRGSDRRPAEPGAGRVRIAGGVLRGQPCPQRGRRRRRAGATDRDRDRHGGRRSRRRRPGPADDAPAWCLPRHRHARLRRGGAHRPPQPGVDGWRARAGGAPHPHRRHGLDRARRRRLLVLADGALSLRPGARGHSRGRAGRAVHGHRRGPSSARGIRDRRGGRRPVRRAVRVLRAAHRARGFRLRRGRGGSGHRRGGRLDHVPRPAAGQRLPDHDPGGPAGARGRGGLDPALPRRPPAARGDPLPARGHRQPDPSAYPHARGSGRRRPHSAPGRPPPPSRRRGRGDADGPGEGVRRRPCRPRHRPGGARRRGGRPHRSQRGGQDHAGEHDQRARTAQLRQRHRSGGDDRAHPGAQAGGRGSEPHLPALQAVQPPLGPGERPGGRPPRQPAHVPAAAAVAAVGAPGRAGSVRACRPVPAPGGARRSGRQPCVVPVLRRPAPAGDRPRPRLGPVPAHPGRAGRRHEPRRGSDAVGADQVPCRRRTDDPVHRAQRRHGAGDLHPGGRAELRAGDRQRLAAGHRCRSSGHRGLPGDRGRRTGHRFDRRGDHGRPDRGHHRGSSGRGGHERGPDGGRHVGASGHDDEECDV